MTCNHVHLLVDAEDRLEMSGFMQKVAGEFARAYNTLQGRIEAFWGRDVLATTLDEIIARRQLERERWWTDRN